MRIISIILIIITSITINSCIEFGVIFNKTKPIKDSKWLSSDTVYFDFEMQNIEQYYDMYILVRNNKNYKWSNLFLFSDITFPNGKTRKDTIEITLADIYGNWTGNNKGSIITTQPLFLKHKKFPLKGNYKIAITHGMRTPTLKNITDVGIKLKKTE